MKSKARNTILNILIVIAALVFVASLISMFSSFGYKQRKNEGKEDEYRRVFEYELKHKAYNEILSSYYAKKLYVTEPPEEYADTFRVAGYAHASFMSRIYKEEKNESKQVLNNKKMEQLKNALGAYFYTADEIDERVSMSRE